jgi:hypothetical protein
MTHSVLRWMQTPLLSYIIVVCLCFFLLLLRLSLLCVFEVVVTLESIIDVSVHTSQCSACVREGAELWMYFSHRFYLVDWLVCSFNDMVKYCNDLYAVLYS